MTPDEVQQHEEHRQHERDAGREHELEHEVEVVLRRRRTWSTPVGHEAVMISTMCGSTNQPAAMPPRNSGIAVKKNPNVYASRVRVSPGTRNAKIWYSQTGRRSRCRSSRAIWMRTSNAPVMLV